MIACPACKVALTGIFHSINRNCDSCTCRELVRGPAGHRARMGGKSGDLMQQIRARFSVGRVDWAIAECRKWADLIYGAKNGQE